MISQALLELGTEAFIGFLRAYREHQCSYIFRMETLDVGAVARSYALFRLPKIKELRVDTVDFVPDEMDTSLIPYKQKVSCMMLSATFALASISLFWS